MFCSVLMLINTVTCHMLLTGALVTAATFRVGLTTDRASLRLANFESSPTA
jgi:hypothetical protein